MASVVHPRMGGIRVDPQTSIDDQGALGGDNQRVAVELGYFGHFLDQPADPVQHLDKLVHIDGRLTPVPSRRADPLRPVTISLASASVSGANRVMWSPSTSTVMPPRPNTTSGPNEGS